MKRIATGDNETINSQILRECNLNEVQDPEVLFNEENVDFFNHECLVLVTGRKAYDLIMHLHNDGFIHIGLRRWDYGQIVALPFLTIKKVRFVFIHANWEDGDSTNKKIEFFMSDKPERPSPDPVKDLEIVNVDDYPRIYNTLNSIMGDDDGMGFDYESCGFPEQDVFQIVGAGYSNLTTAKYIDYRYYSSEDILEKFKKATLEFLGDHHNNLWVFNKSFENRATYRHVNKFLDFPDVRSLSKCDEMRGSLKFQAQYYLGCSSWDDDNEEYMDQYNKILWHVKTFEDLLQRVDDPDEKVRDEVQYFIKWIKESGQEEDIIRNYFGFPFAMSPKPVIGKYCCYDSYYTIKIRNEIRENNEYE